MTAKRDNPYGDDAGTRVGRPSTPDRKKDSETTGTGDEAAEGIHGSNTGGGADRPGSEPLRERTREHSSNYGGKGGAPRTGKE